MPMRFAQGHAGADHETVLIDRIRREFRERIAPLVGERIVQVQSLVDRQQRVQTPAQQSQIVIRIGRVLRILGRQ